MASLKVLNKNVVYFGQQLNALLDNTSATVKFICILSFFIHFLSYSDEAIRLLSVTPGYIIPPSFWVWTAFTYCFLEIHFWEVCVDIVTIVLCGKLIEPLWGQTEMFIFFTVVNLGCAILSAFFYLFLYMCTFNTDLLFFVHIHGLAGYIAGLSVAVKQVMPDHMIVKTPLGTNPTMFTSGILVSWTYLRFYQHHSNGSRGDLADNFTFSSFFPNVLQPPISIVSNTIYSGLVRLGLCRKTVRRFDMSAAPTGVTVTLPGNDSHDMERRRQIALKALNERLGKASMSSSVTSSSSGLDKVSTSQRIIPKDTTIVIPANDANITRTTANAVDTTSNLTTPLLPNQIELQAQVHHVIDT
ncbi:hypothetical protein O3M35_001480 [Rhynocoris fuscipes]|uniref:Transmembrane protein 115 n=1 Tax=Rhynocoris fuscipes TaxID=488301 RepID=A0AAW1CR14_9HEMI